MNTIPAWWLFLSGLFFVTNTLLVAGLIVVLLKVGKVAEDVKPRVEDLSKKVDTLLETVQGVAVKVDHLADSAKVTLDGVGTKTQNVMGSAELIANTASRSFERFSPYIVGTMTAIRLFKALSELRGSKKQSNLPAKRR